jgi:hypothetical protein
MEPSMPLPAITAVNILERRRREDGGADLLVQVTLQAADICWLAVRKADATLTATQFVLELGPASTAGSTAALSVQHSPLTWRSMSSV